MESGPKILVFMMSVASLLCVVGVVASLMDYYDGSIERVRAFASQPRDWVKAKVLEAGIQYTGTDPECYRAVKGKSVSKKPCTAGDEVDKLCHGVLEQKYPLLAHGRRLVHFGYTPTRTHTATHHGVQMASIGKDCFHSYIPWVRVELSVNGSKATRCAFPFGTPKTSLISDASNGDWQMAGGFMMHFISHGSPWIWTLRHANGCVVGLEKLDVLVKDKEEHQSFLPIYAVVVSVIGITCFWSMLVVVFVSCGGLEYLDRRKNECRTVCCRPADPSSLTPQTTEPIESRRAQQYAPVGEHDAQMYDPNPSIQEDPEEPKGNGVGVPIPFAVQ